MGQFRTIKEFPDYEVNELGQVRSVRRNLIISNQVTYGGVCYVSLRQNGAKLNRSIAVLVAKTFLEPAEREQDNVVIHLDGDRNNCRADNLAWRTRSFAVAYHRQFTREHPSRIFHPLKIAETNEVFPNSLALASAYGLLENGVILCALNILGGDGDYTVYPGNFHILFA